MKSRIMKSKFESVIRIGSYGRVWYVEFLALLNVLVGVFLYVDVFKSISYVASTKI